MALSVEYSAYSVHCEKVNSLCRICAERVKRQIKDKLTPLKLCATYEKELYSYHGLDTAQDEEDKHPKGMCTKCYQRLASCKRAGYSTNSNSKTASDRAAADIERANNIIWTMFDQAAYVGQCTACSHFDTQCKGGRPKKCNVRAPGPKLRLTMSDSSCDSVADTELDCSGVAGPSTSTPMKKRRTADTRTSPIMTVKTPPSKGLLWENCGNNTIPF